MEFGRYLAKGIWGLADKALPVVYGLGYIYLVIRVLPEEEFGNWVLLQEVFLLISGLATAFALNPLLKYAAAPAHAANSLQSYWAPLTANDGTWSGPGQIPNPDPEQEGTPTSSRGNAIAFALTQQPDAKRGFGSDIYMVDLDGRNLHAVVLHEDNNVFYASPRDRELGRWRRVANVGDGGLCVADLSSSTPCRFFIPLR